MNFVRLLPLSAGLSFATLLRIKIVKLDRFAIGVQFVLSKIMRFMGFSSIITIGQLIYCFELLQLVKELPMM